MTQDNKKVNRSRFETFHTDIPTIKYRHFFFCISLDITKTVDKSRSTTLKPLEVNDKVKNETKHAASEHVHLLEDSTHNLQNRSLCPWTYRIQTDSNRQPAQLIKTHCLQPRVTASANVCHEVFYYIQVKYKQTSSNGGLIWVDDWLKWSVGCMVATPLPHRALPPTEAEEPTLP